MTYCGWCGNPIYATKTEWDGKLYHPLCLEKLQEKERNDAITRKIMRGGKPREFPSE
jgi:hypothetical protein